MATSLTFFGFLSNPVSIQNPGDAVDVEIDPIQPSQIGITVPQAGLVAQLASIIAVGNPWNTLTLHLFLDTLAPVPTTPLADFVANEATFTGYAAQAIVWLAPENNNPNQADIPAQLLQFIATAVPTGQTVRGFFVTHA